MKLKVNFIKTTLLGGLLILLPLMLLVLLLPKAPAAFSGPVKVVSRSKIELLDAGLRETSQVISHWGVGLGDLLGKKEG